MFELFQVLRRFHLGFLCDSFKQCVVFSNGLWNVELVSETFWEKDVLIRLSHWKLKDGSMNTP